MDTPGKKLLVGVAVTYLALVLLVPTLNVFVQVAPTCLRCAHASAETLRSRLRMFQVPSSCKTEIFAACWLASRCVADPFRTLTDLYLTGHRC